MHGPNNTYLSHVTTQGLLLSLYSVEGLFAAWRFKHPASSSSNRNFVKTRHFCFQVFRESSLKSIKSQRSQVQVSNPHFCLKCPTYNFAHRVRDLKVSLIRYLTAKGAFICHTGITITTQALQCFRVLPLVPNDLLCIMQLWTEAMGWCQLHDWGWSLW